MKIGSVFNPISFATEVHPSMPLAYYSIPFLLYWTDGNRYEGEFRDDMRNGQGTYYAKIEVELKCFELLNQDAVAFKAKTAASTIK